MFTVNDLLVVFLIGVVIGALLSRSRPTGGYFN
jgi:hypothetical protein